MEKILDKYFPNSFKGQYVVSNWFTEDTTNELLEELMSVGYCYNLTSRLRGKNYEPLKEHQYSRDERMKNIKFLSDCGSPYYLGTQHVYFCHQAGRMKFFSKSREVMKRESTGSKKIGCSSSIVKTEIIVFNNPEYSKAGFYSRRKRDAIKEKIRYGDENPSTEVRYSLTWKTRHCHPPTPSNLPIHPSLAAKIKELASAGVTNTKSIQLILKDEVVAMFNQKKLPLPNPNNSHYFPHSKNIYNRVSKVLLKLKQSQGDKNKEIETQDRTSPLLDETDTIENNTVQEHSTTNNTFYSESCNCYGENCVCEVIGSFTGVEKLSKSINNKQEYSIAKECLYKTENLISEPIDSGSNIEELPETLLIQIQDTCRNIIDDVLSEIFLEDGLMDALTCIQHGYRLLKDCIIRQTPVIMPQIQYCHLINQEGTQIPEQASFSRRQSEQFERTS